ncbi:LysM peptidoglycan-binding domain-containing protein [Pseudomonas aeruginosa]
MTEPKICTCPSGDGSLRWPCPKHPAVEQAGGDERAAFNRWIAEQQLCQGSDISLFTLERNGALVSLHDLLRDAYQAGQARAALAQPSPKCATCGGTGMVDDGEITCSEGGIPYENGPVKCVKDCPDCKAQPTPALADEKPGDSILCYGCFAKGVGPDHFDEAGKCLAAQAEKAEVELPKLERPKHWGLHGANFRAGFKAAEAQHERIVGALRADRDSWAEQAEQRLADWDEMRKERDAALARVGHQERTIAGMNEEHAKLAGLYEAAQAQHSGPAYVSYTTQPAESLAGIALRQLKDESRWVEIRDINAHAFPDMRSHSYYPAGTVIKLPAAAPGNSVPQAWLDVQAERRRQITAEGWTPEHDDEHADGQMARAAACYALAGSSAPNDGTAALLVSLAWPWDEQWWKPTTVRRDLVKACALALAEIERLDRACISQSPQPGATTASS